MSKRQIKIFLSLLLAATFVLALSACAPGELKSPDTGAESEAVTAQEKAKSKVRKDRPKLSLSSDSYPLTVTDADGVETELKALPKRVAVLAGTPLNIWYDLGGSSICTSQIADKNLKILQERKDEMLALPEVGAVYALNMEAILAQEPDLVIAQSGVQTQPIKALRDMDIPVISTLTLSFQDVLNIYQTFGILLQKPDLAEARIAKMKEEYQSYKDKLPAQSKSVVIIYLTADSLAVKLDHSIAGEIAKELKIKNIASGLPAMTLGSEAAPLDIEYVVEKDPDMILVTSMVGSNELAVETMKKHFADNAAWQSVRAVAENQVYYLPQEYFLYNGGPYYMEAVHYMASTVYPEIFGPVSEWYKENK